MPSHHPLALGRLSQDLPPTLGVDRSTKGLFLSLIKTTLRLLRGLKVYWAQE